MSFISMVLHWDFKWNNMLGNLTLCLHFCINPGELLYNSGTTSGVKGSITPSISVVTNDHIPIWTGNENIKKIKG